MAKKKQKKKKYSKSTKFKSSLKLNEVSKEDYLKDIPEVVDVTIDDIFANAPKPISSFEKVEEPIEEIKKEEFVQEVKKEEPLLEDKKEIVIEKRDTKICSPFVLFLICYLSIEAIFNCIGFGISEFATFVRVLSFSILNCFLIRLLLLPFKNESLHKIIYSIILVFYSCYAVAELQFKNFLGIYYSFISVAEGGLGKISSLIVYFIQTIPAAYYLCLLPLIIFFVLLRICKEDTFEFKRGIVVFVLSVLILLGFFKAGLNDNQFENYFTHNDIDITFEKFGLTHTFVRDIVAIKYRKQEEIVIEEPVEEEPIVEEVVKEEKKHREFDDTLWKNLIENETNSAIKDIDNYLIKRQISDYNEKTGIFEGYNFIYILCESLDYIAIDETLTPTLYKMFKEGYSFTNHYTPIYACGTGDSDMTSLTSLFPLGSSCTFYKKQNNNYSESIAALFKNEGYDTYAFHNWNDEFYERSVAYPNMDFDVYYDVSDLDFKLVLGWQSDKVLMEKAYDIFSKSEHYMAYIVTSSMHFPYDMDSYLGNKNLSRINEVYPDYPIEIKRYLSKCMEFDEAMQYLLNQLEADGTLDKTVIAFYPDHYPFKIQEDVVREYGDRYIDRTSWYDLNSTPFVIYNSQIEPTEYENIISTMDQVPTLANMFNLNYDPRLYMGDDIFSKDATVIFANGNWMNKYGIYYNAYDKFEYFDANKTMSDSSLAATKKQMKNKIASSRAILNEDYFKYREQIVKK